MQPPVEFWFWFLLTSLVLCIGVLVASHHVFARILQFNERLVETNRVLALGYANPNAALRLTQQQTSQTNAKRDAVHNQIKLAQTREAITQAQRNVAGRCKLPREAPHLKFHNPADDDLVPPKSEDKEGKGKK